MDAIRLHQIVLDQIYTSTHRQHNRWYPHSLASSCFASENISAETDRNSSMNWLQGYTFEKVPSRRHNLCLAPESVWKASKTAWLRHVCTWEFPSSHGGIPLQLDVLFHGLSYDLVISGQPFLRKALYHRHIISMRPHGDKHQQVKRNAWVKYRLQTHSLVHGCHGCDSKQL